MDAEILDGSAFTLFGAYEERPSLRGLNKLLFTSGPHPKEVIEITGEAGSGKSYILLDLLAKCLLPREQNGLSVGGMGSGAVLLNADQHLNLFRLVRMMEVRVRRRLKELDEAQIEDIISTSLKRLAVLDVFSEEELALALRSARNHIFFNSDVSLIALDSIAANFWSTAAQCGMRKFDSYVEDTLKSIRHLIADFKITLLYTRPAYFFSKSGLPSELSLNYDLGNVNTRIVLKGSSVKRAEVHSGSSVHIAFYECSENGVQWTNNSSPTVALCLNGSLLGFPMTKLHPPRWLGNKRHNPFGGKEPIDQTCAFSSNNPTEVSQWWQNQKASNACPNPILDWNWQGKNGYWTVQYSYIDSAKRTVCDVYYQGNGMSRMRVIKWELDETKQSVTYATNPFRIYEDGWQVSLRPSETWGFTPTGNGLWIFQHFSRNLVFQPFQAVRGTVTYNGRGTSGQNAPLYYAVGSPGQSAPVYTVGSSMSTPFYTAGTPIYQVGTQMTNPMYMYSAGSPGQSTPVYAVGSSVNTPFYTAGTPVYQIGTQMTNPTYTYTVGTPGQSTPVYTVGSSINTPFYSAGNPVYQFGTQITNPTYTYPVSQPVPGTQVYTVDSAPIQNPPK